MHTPKESKKMEIRDLELNRLKAIESLESYEEQYANKLRNMVGIIETEYYGSKDSNLSNADKRKHAALQKLRLNDTSFVDINKMCKELKHNITVAQIEINAKQRSHERECYKR